MDNRGFPFGNELNVAETKITDFTLDPKEDSPHAGPDSGGQSGDSQGLSQAADAADESVEELVDTGQTFEADAVAGVEDAADHPEQPVRSHEDFRRPRSVPLTD